MILKGHLLIEEQIKLIINERVRKHESLSDARLTFHQLICIAEAFLPESNYILKPVRAHGPLENVFADVWVVKGGSRLPLPIPVRITKTMTIVRNTQTRELTLINAR